MAAEAEELAVVEAKVEPRIEAIPIPYPASSLLARHAPASGESETRTLAGLAAAILLLPGIGFLAWRRGS